VGAGTWGAELGVNVEQDRPRAEWLQPDGGQGEQQQSSLPAHRSAPKRLCPESTLLFWSAGCGAGEVQETRVSGLWCTRDWEKKRKYTMVI